MSSYIDSNNLTIKKDLPSVISSLGCKFPEYADAEYKELITITLVQNGLLSIEFIDNPSYKIRLASVKNISKFLLNRNIKI